MTKSRRHFRQGFTMVELMAILVIIGLLAEVVSTKASLKVLHASVIQFKLDTGRYPTEEENLDALVNPPSDVEYYEPGGYLETNAIPKDGWGNDFVYELYPDDGKPFRVVSYGADGEPDGEEYDADLSSTDP